jgi:hypothetical protein
VVYKDISPSCAPGANKTAAVSLVGFDDAGLPFLRKYLVNTYPRIPRVAAGKAIENMAAAVCNHVAAAKSILDEVAVAEDEAECQRAKEVTRKCSVSCIDTNKK